MKVIITIILLYLFAFNYFSEDSLPSIEELCNEVENEIKDLELMKNNLKKEFKYKDSELEQFELLPELTKDINKVVQQQILQAKLYHYLDCPRFSLKKAN